MARKADPFAVWGKPPPPLDKLPPKHLDVLRRYVESVASASYRTAYDNGLVEGLCKISMTAAAELRLQRNRMLKGAPKCPTKMGTQSQCKLRRKRQ